MRPLAPLIEVTIPLRSHDEAIIVLGPYDRNAKLLRQALEIEIHQRHGNLRLKGDDRRVNEARRRIEHLIGKIRKGRSLIPDEVEQILLGGPAAEAPTGAKRSSDRAIAARPPGNGGPLRGSSASRSSRWQPIDPRSLRVRAVEPRSANQARYFEAIQSHALTFGIGVAGTGKTFLAVAAAVRSLRSGDVRRLVVTRPVVEAGEHLGFLPGDLQAKLDPYLRPIHDALGTLIGPREVTLLQEANIIEIAPLAYMRGRTLAGSFVILDEAQNTTVGQMKMFLTRLGEGSRMVVTGDVSQTDLAEGAGNGLVDALRRLRGYEGVAVAEFDGKDIVRHPLVERIVHAYEAPAPVKGAGSKTQR